MNPKVLFAVQGEGRGHMTQAIALYDLFKKIILRFVARLSELVTEEPYLIFSKAICWSSNHSNSKSKF